MNYRHVIEYFEKYDNDLVLNKPLVSLDRGISEELI